MKHLGVYYRVSTDRQDLASQKSAFQAWLATLPEAKKPLTIQEFKDHGISGKTTQRKAYQALLKAAFEQKIDTIVVYRLDRLSRNATEAIQTLLIMDQAGVGFISMTQPVLNLGLDNPFRRTMLAAFSEIAEIERETIVSRVRSGLAAAKKRGVKLGRPKAYTEEQQQLVRAKRAQGLSYEQIAQELGMSRGTAHSLGREPAMESNEET
ncbi:MAG: recombinase family protein [Pseudobdellovibrionaceae bacterium]|uniref:recombinase family protein n=1 Tax=Oligoflexus sp. TaxID=1971216 RepID=UPI0027CA44E7|nr:recombinase family protein [Oligoflexus sp.]MDQ3233110.1 recombinase family protein [Pseudobdellovibrionaceae bacterium]HYX35850.1 recombinase family protein [Oligoflexus sp.]